MPEEKTPEQISKPARRVSPPPATERPACAPVPTAEEWERIVPRELTVRSSTSVHSNEAFARKVEAAKYLFLKELQKRYSDTSHEALWLGKPIEEREKRDSELEPLLISWLELSVQCLENWFWELHNIAATSPDGPKDSAADWASKAAGEVVRGYFKFEKEINEVEPNTIFWWWRFATEHADGRVSQDVPERWNTNFPSRIDYVLESLVHHAALGIKAPSLARTMAASDDLSDPDPVRGVITPALEGWEQITPADEHQVAASSPDLNDDPSLPSVAELMSGTDYENVAYDSLTLKKIDVILEGSIGELNKIAHQTAFPAGHAIACARDAGEDVQSQEATIMDRADSWQKQSLGSIEKWFWKAYEVGVTSSLARNVFIPDWAFGLTTSIVDWYFFKRRIPPPHPPTIMHWWLAVVRSRNILDRMGELRVGVVFDLEAVFQNRFQVLLLQLQGEAVLKWQPPVRIEDFESPVMADAAAASKPIQGAHISIEKTSASGADPLSRQTEASLAVNAQQGKIPVPIPREAGRPRLDEERARILQLRKMNYSWPKVANVMNKETGQTKDKEAYRSLVRTKRKQ
jgi:hypothetical protein